MSKKKKDKPADPPAGQINFRPTKEIAAALRAYRDKVYLQVGVKPTPSAVMRESLKMFLGAHGFPVPTAEDDD